MEIQYIRVKLMWRGFCKHQWVEKKMYCVKADQLARNAHRESSAVYGRTVLECFEAEVSLFFGRHIRILGARFGSVSG